nr:eukaryotic translation initiation factor 5B-like [Quercus suber]
MAELGNLRRQEVFLSLKRYLGMAVQATYRLEEEANNQSKALDQERDKRLNAMRTLKNSEADIKKAREELKEMTRARDSVITDLKKKLAEVKGAKNAAKWARDEALRAKKEAEFARIEAETSKEKAEELAFDLGVAETQAGVEASSDLWKVENVYYPSAFRESGRPSSEAGTSLEVAEAGHPNTAPTSTAPDEPAEEAEPSGGVETEKDLDQEAPQDAAKPSTEAQAPHAKETALSVEPFQTVPPSESSKDFETAPAQPPKE